MNDKTLEIAKGYVELGKPIPANHGQTLITRIEALEAALHFYADYHPQPSEGPWGANSKDFGDVARKALEGTGNG